MLLLARVLLAFAVMVGGPVARAADSLATVAPSGLGPYTVACSNVSQDFTRVASGGTAADYWNGNPGPGGARYVTDVLSAPSETFSISVPIPGDADLYGRFAGSSLSVVSLIC